MILLGSDTSSSYLTSLYLSGGRAELRFKSSDEKCNFASNVSHVHNTLSFVSSAVSCNISLLTKKRTGTPESGLGLISGVAHQVNYLLSFRLESRR